MKTELSPLTVRDVVLCLVISLILLVLVGVV